MEIRNSDSVVEEALPLKATCFHCGEDCEEEYIHYQDKDFCCQGCKVVYSLLSENGLTDFYQLDEKPKINFKQKKESKFKFLDHEEIQQRIIQYSEKGHTSGTLYLPQIHCISCLWLLEKLPWLCEGIKQAKVNYPKKELFIAFDETKISLREVAEFLAVLGYPPHFSLDQHQSKKSTSKPLLYRLGITGFCAGNIMLLSFPDYLGFEDIPVFWLQVFRGLIVLLALPVVAYGAKPYWQSAWQALKYKVINIDVPITLGILIIFVRSLIEIITFSGNGYLDSLAMLVFFLLIGKWLQNKTFAHISFERDYKAYFPLAVSKIEGDKEISVPLEKLKAGDEILVRNGELVPADAILVEGTAFMDCSFITGESKLIEKEVGDQVYAGSKQKGGLIHLKLLKSVSQSYLTQLWNADAFKKAKKASLTDRLSPKFTTILLAVATLTFVYWAFVLHDMTMAFNAATAVLIVACPCALALNVPFTLGNAIRQLTKQGVFLKNTTVLEEMATCNHFVFDKTGTITSGQIIKFEGDPLDQQQQQLAIHSLASCSVHPISQQIASSTKTSLSRIAVSDFGEVAGAGISGWINHDFIAIGNAEFITEKCKSNEVLSPVIGAYVCINGVLVGKFQTVQKIRTGMHEMLEDLSKSNAISLISGDTSAAVEEIVSDLPTTITYKYEQKPIEKLGYIESLQAQQEKVMMLGDGLNDAGAIKQADIGVAVSESIHEFSPASDVIMKGNQLAILPTVIQYTKDAMKVVHIGYVLSIIYNILGITFAVQGLLEPVIAAILMPLSSITVVGVGYICTNVLAKRFKPYTMC